MSHECDRACRFDRDAEHCAIIQMSSATVMGAVDCINPEIFARVDEMIQRDEYIKIFCTLHANRDAGIYYTQPF